MAKTTNRRSMILKLVFDRASMPFSPHNKAWVVEEFLPEGSGEYQTRGSDVDTFEGDPYEVIFPKQGRAGVKGLAEAGDIEIHISCVGPSDKPKIQFTLKSGNKVLRVHKLDALDYYTKYKDHMRSVTSSRTMAEASTQLSPRASMRLEAEFSINYLKTIVFGDTIVAGSHSRFWKTLYKKLDQAMAAINYEMASLEAGESPGIRTMATVNHPSIEARLT